MKKKTPTKTSRKDAQQGGPPGRPAAKGLRPADSAVAREALHCGQKHPFFVGVALQHQTASIDMGAARE